MLKANGKEQRICSISQKKQVNKFLFVSSIAVFDKKNEQGEIDEASAFDCNQEPLGMRFLNICLKWEVWRAKAGKD